MALWFVIRSGIIIGASYYTYRAGVWSTSEKTEQLYNEARSELSPLFNKVTHNGIVEFPTLPERAEVRFLATHYYNKGVKNVFNFVLNVPSNVQKLVDNPDIVTQYFKTSK